MITVYFDGKCGLCNREISYYQKIAPIGLFGWSDVTQDRTLTAKHGISIETGLKILHAEDHYGTLHRGVDAFILIWYHLPRWHVLGRLVSLPPVRWCAQRLYGFFAEWRFNRASHCQVYRDKNSNFGKEPAE